MRKIYLLAMALPIAFAACSNEEDLMTSQEVAGQKLASKTVLTVNRDIDATTRLNANGWESGDKVGLAWFNNTSDGAITDDQNAELCESFDQDDAKIYANHLFTYANGLFTNEGDVYNGSYFSYFPYARQAAGNGASQKTIELNTKQTVTDASKAFFAGVFSISARDMITADDINNDGAVEKQFSLQQLANGIAVKTTLGNKGDYTEEQIAGMKVTKVALTIADNNIFASTFKLNPQKLPKAVYTEGVYDATKTLRGMTLTALVGTDATKAIEKTLVDELSVEVGECDATLASANDGFVLFTLPTVATDVDVNKVTLTIRTVAGKVTLKYTAGSIAGSVAAANNSAIEKLVALLGTTGYKNGGNTYKLSEVLNQRIGLDFKVDMSKFTPINDDIKTAEEWNAAVKYFDTFMPEITPVFTITENIEFTSNELMTLPKKGLAGIAGNKSIIIKSGNNVIDKKIAKSSVNLTIAEGASLTVAADASKDKAAFLTLADDKSITNNGTLIVNGEIAGPSGNGEAAKITNNNEVVVGQDGKINSVDEGGAFSITVENVEKATIAVSYNSYVHHNATGTIKGVIDGNDAIAKVYYSYLVDRMVAGVGTAANSGKTGTAVACNTIELKNITVTEGDKSTINSGDLPWGGTGEYPIVTSTFKNINVVLNAASLKGAGTDAMEYGTITSEGASSLAGVFTGGAITVESGALSVGQYINANKTTNSKITIDDASNLKVEKGATLNVYRTKISKPDVLENAGSINLTGDALAIDGVIAATKIVNKKTGVITVGTGGKMTYESGNFTSEEGAISTGNIIAEMLN